MYSKTCISCQRTSLNRWFGNRTMTSNCDVTNSAQQTQMTTLCHWMKPPPWKLSAYATVWDFAKITLTRVSSHWLWLESSHSVKDVTRVARLAFLRPKSRHLAFLKVFWHDKVLFGMYVIVLHFFGLFWWCWHEKTLFGIFWNLWLSCCCRLGIENFSQDKGPLFSTTARFSKILVVLPSKWRHGAKNMIAYFLGKTSNSVAHLTLYNVLSGADCAVFGK